MLVLQVGRTVVWADLDGDAKLDVLVGNVSALPNRSPRHSVFRNTTLDVGSHLFVKLRGTSDDRDGLGAEVEVVVAGRRSVEVRSYGTGLLSASAAPLHFGLGAALVADEVIVRWPYGGGTDRIQSVPANQTLEVVPRQRPRFSIAYPGTPWYRREAR